MNEKIDKKSGNYTKENRNLSEDTIADYSQN